MTRQEIILELKASIKQLEKMGDLTKEIKTYHSICTGGYMGDYREIDQLDITFIEEEGDVVVMEYSVCEI
tara:strand:- start:173 stop:382 length:210 start_codon:yes stop_codon:yes gene_type:complete